VNPNNRKANQLHLSNAARTAHAAALRADRRAEVAHQEADAFRAEVEALRVIASTRLGVDVADDPLLVDVCSLIDLEQPGAVWRWRGIRNPSHGTPIISMKGHTLTVVRYLAIAFNVIDPSWNGILHPLNGQQTDVSPWHRQLRPSAEKVGNPKGWHVEKSA
jgi:hypothetical protein